MAMLAMLNSETISITVCISAAETALAVPAGTSVAAACELLSARGESVDTGYACGIWGQVVSVDTVLKHGDRLEFYAPLIADPKATRRRRDTLPALAEER